MKPLFLLLLSFCFAIHSFGQWTKVMLRNDVLVTDQIYDAYFINTDTGYLTTKNGVLYKTRDGGYSWTFDTVNPGGSLKRIFFATNDIGYMTVGGGNYQIIGTVLKTTDGGSTWSDVGRGNKMGFAYGLYFLNPDTGFVGCGAGLYFTTYNGGQSWTWKFLDALEITDIRFFNDTSGYMFQRCGLPGFVGGVTTTKDGGMTWKTHCDNLTYQMFGIGYACMLNDSIYIGISDRYKLVKGHIDSIQGRVLLEKGRTGGNVYPRNIHFYSEKLGMIAFGSRVMRTEDGGENWVYTDMEPYDSTANMAIYGYAYPALQYIVAITENKWITFGEYGRVFITENKGGLMTGLTEAKGNEMFTIYPNPARERISISLSPISSILSFQILTPDGRLVLQGRLNGEEAGVNISGLSSGLYFMLVQDDRQRVVRKFVKE